MSGSARHDIIAAALVQTIREQELELGPELESIAEEALALMPTANESPRGDLRYEFADGLYPSKASRAMLETLRDVHGRPLVPYLRAHRDRPPPDRFGAGRGGDDLGLTARPSTFSGVSIALGPCNSALS